MLGYHQAITVCQRAIPSEVENFDVAMEHTDSPKLKHARMPQSSPVLPSPPQRYHQDSPGSDSKP